MKKNKNSNPSLVNNLFDAFNTTGSAASIASVVAGTTRAVNQNTATTLDEENTNGIG